MDGNASGRHRDREVHDPRWVGSSAVRCIERLLTYVNGPVALTGGAAIALRLGMKHRSSPPSVVRPDLDFVAAAADVVAPTATGEFLVSHYHLPQPGYPKFLIQLVHRETALRVDVFPDALGALARAPTFRIGNASVLVLTLEDVLAHKVLTLAKASPTAPVDQKHLEDARLLATHLGQRAPSVPLEAATAAIPFSQDVDASCARCEVSRRADFPLAPKSAIRALLGYV